MKSYSYKPTDDNVLHLLKSNLIGRKQDIMRFLALLSNMEDDCYSIALNGEWGSGKTFFIKQTPILLSDRLKEVYAALFSKPSGRYRREVTIGSMTFEKSTRRYLEEIASMLSPQSEYQFE